MEAGNGVDLGAEGDAVMIEFKHKKCKVIKLILNQIDRFEDSLLDQQIEEALAIARGEIRNDGNDTKETIPAVYEEYEEIIETTTYGPQGPGSRSRSREYGSNRTSLSGSRKASCPGMLSDVEEECDQTTCPPDVENVRADSGVGRAARLSAANPQAYVSNGASSDPGGGSGPSDGGPGGGQIRGYEDEGGGNNYTSAPSVISPGHGYEEGGGGNATRRSGGGGGAPVVASSGPNYDDGGGGYDGGGFSDGGQRRSYEEDRSGYFTRESGSVGPIGGSQRRVYEEDGGGYFAEERGSVGPIAGGHRRGFEEDGGSYESCFIGDVSPAKDNPVIANDKSGGGSNKAKVDNDPIENRRRLTDVNDNSRSHGDGGIWAWIDWILDHLARLGLGGGENGDERLDRNKFLKYLGAILLLLFLALVLFPCGTCSSCRTKGCCMSSLYYWLTSKEPHVKVRHTF